MHWPISIPRVYLPLIINFKGIQFSIIVKNLILLAFSLIAGLVMFESSSKALTSYDGRLILYNTHTSEKLDIKYLDKLGKIDKSSKEKINWILRSFSDDKVIDIDDELITILDQIQDHFGKDKIVEIISGYRSPEYNTYLRRKGRGVAKRSLHLKGKAIDFRIKDVPLSKLDKYTLSLKKGGVGYYSSSNFIHIDTGPARKWGYRSYTIKGIAKK